MKVIFLTAALFLVASTTAFSETITVTGIRAKALIDIGNDTQSTEGAMGGRTDMELRNVKCEKIVDEKLDIYVQKCAFSAFQDVVVSSDAEKNRQTPEDFRMILREIANNEIQVSDSKKTIEVKLIKCHGAGSGHALDNLSIEPTFKCTIVK